MIIKILWAVGALVMLGIVFLNLSRRKRRGTALPSGYRALLETHVGFYRSLGAEGREKFCGRLKAFLSQVRIHGVKIVLEDLDIVLVAASAVIPVWGFREWTYNNLTDVLLYEGSFDMYHFAGPENRRNVLGMVGGGAMERVMILSRPALRDGYADVDGTGSTGIHEFAHLIDKSDGAVDGIPESLLGEKTVDWAQIVRRYLEPVRAARTDISPYGGSNAAEFFAVVSEYFFKRPDLMETRHPELFVLLCRIYQQKPLRDPLTGLAEGMAGGNSSHI